MKNQEFKIDTKAGVVVFCQKSHGKDFTSKTKANNIDNFNIGIGQLIAMKRNEINIRKEDIKSMQGVLEQCKAYMGYYKGSTAGKLYTNFMQITSDKIKMSYNHIHELQKDLDTLYSGTYIVKPYSEIVEFHKIARKGNDEDKSELFKQTYAVPEEIINGTHIFDIVNGTTVLVENIYK